jgi:hypothetical protein
MRLHDIQIGRRAGLDRLLQNQVRVDSFCTKSLEETAVVDIAFQSENLVPGSAGRLSQVHLDDSVGIKLRHIEWAKDFLQESFRSNAV